MQQLDAKISAEGSQINGYNEFHLVISSIYEALKAGNLDDALKTMQQYEQKRLPYLQGYNSSCNYLMLKYQGEYLWTTLLHTLYLSD